MHTEIIKYCLTALAAALLVAEARATAAGIAGDVQIAGGLIAGSTVTLYAAGTGASTKAGDFIHFFQSSTTKIPNIGSIGPAGNLRVANNWDSDEAATSADPFRPTSTQGGGSGFTVFYVVAVPVKTSLIGTVRQP
jgi:hypothetical protein